ncbi:unnamed protein product [Haemonchus placei]|uniref:Uncharacterized protein n=1 Tax=Haemonchus placei TaxID=6290 RepID=A0A0N4WZK2_HAEPC|nr:unnamed protein product [Haemonchus placei]
MYPYRTRKAAILSASNQQARQDSAPAHRAKVVQDPLDYNLWSYLESKACATPHPNLDSLKAAHIKNGTKSTTHSCVRSSTLFPIDSALSSVPKVAVSRSNL